MKIDWNKRTTVRTVSSIIVVAFGILLYFLLLNLKTISGIFSWFFTIIAPVILGFVFAYLLNTPMSLIEMLIYKINGKNKKISARFVRILSIVLTLLIALSLIFALFYVIIPQLIESVSTLINNANGYVSVLENAIYNLLNKYNISSSYIDDLVSRYDDVFTYIINLLKDSLPSIISFSRQLTTGIYNIFIGIIISVYVLYNKEVFGAQLKKICFALFKKGHVDKFFYVLHKSNKAFIGFINGKLLDSLIIGILCYIGLLILKMPYALLVSAIIAVTNVIPYLGPFIGAILSALIIFIVSPIKALIFIIFIFILQQIDGNFLGPRILGNSIGISSFWVLVSIIIGGGLFGPIGMFLGVPAFSVIYSLLRIFIESKLVAKGLSPNTKDYYLGSIPSEAPKNSKSFLFIKKLIEKIKSKKNKQK